MSQHTIVDQGYTVPAICQHPGCDTVVHRGLVHICGVDPAGGDTGCGLHFCGAHLQGEGQTCARCAAGKAPYAPKSERPEFPAWRLTDPAWAAWREANPELVERTRQAQMAHEARKREKAEEKAQNDAQRPAEVVDDVPPPAPEPEPPAPGKSATKQGSKKS